MQAYGDLTVRGLAQRARILARHPDRVFALFGKSGIVHNPSYGRGESAFDVPGHLPPEGFPSPRTLADTLLQTLLSGVRQALGYGPDAFALAVQQ